MAEKSVITNIEARIRQLIDDHKRLSESCAELTAQRDNLKAENRTLQERIRELDGELSRMQLTEGLAGESRNREKARARVNRLMRGRLTNASHCSEGPNNGKGRRTGSNAATSTRAADE